MEEISSNLQQFGYSVVRAIESGSKVFQLLEVSSTNSLEYFVCKVYDMNNETSQEMIKESFDAEVNSTTMLHETCTVKFIDKIQSNKYNFLIFNYFESITLHDYIVEVGVAKNDMRKKIFQQLLNIIDKLHSAGAAHRQIEPKNILISKEGTIQLINFEHSVFYTYNEKSEKSPPLSAFTAPEVLKGEKYDPFKADIWSIGLTVICMVIGKIPFAGKSYDEVLKLISETKIIIPNGIDQNLYSTILRCMRIVPDQRPTVEELKIALKKRVQSVQLPNLGVRKITPLARYKSSSSSYSNYTRN